MHKQNAIPIVAIVVSLAVATGITWAGSHGSTHAWGMPLFALCGALAFVVNWLAFVPAYVYQTEHYYDLMGSLTYLMLILTAFGLAESADPRALLLVVLITIWAVRLGSFLFLRIRKDGSDGRFDRITPHPLRFLMTWTLQGLWVFVTLSCALAAITSAETRPLGGATILGLAIWGLGFAVEVTADHQKRVFRANPENRGRFITTGLWAWSRHPNYLGEITLWIGISVLALPVLSGWQLATLVSPIFVFVLLTRISGVPLLEARADERWGNDAAYAAYKSRTPVLFPRRPAKMSAEDVRRERH